MPSDGIFDGLLGSVTVGGTVVGEIAEWALDVERAAVGVTAFGESWERIVASLRDASGSFTGNFGDADAAQAALRDALANGNSVSLALWLDADTRFELSAYLTDESEGVTVNGADTTVFDYVMSGQLTYATLRYALLQNGDNILLQTGDLLKLEGV